MAASSLALRKCPRRGRAGAYAYAVYPLSAKRIATFEQCTDKAPIFASATTSRSCAEASLAKGPRSTRNTISAEAEVASRATLYAYMIGPRAAPSLPVHRCFRYWALEDNLTAVTPFGQGT